MDDLDTFFDNIFVGWGLDEPWFTVSTDCDFDPDQMNTITGTLKFNINGDCDATDATAFSNTLIKTEVGNNSFGTVSNDMGGYTLRTDTGQNTVFVVSGLPSYFQVTPNTQTVNFSGYGNTEQIDFCISASSDVNDLNIAIIPLNSVSPGFESDYKIVYENMGTTILSGQLTFQFDDNFQTYVAASQTPVSITSNTLTFDYANIQPLQNQEIEVSLQNETPPTLNSGDILSLTAQISDTNDYTPDDNTFTLDQTVSNSFDPNDKRVLEGDKITEDQTDDYLHYIIRFQNTGTANAQNVVVTDTLSANLDWNTLKMVSSSDAYQVKIENGNAVEFSFKNIALPFEDADEEGSHGYIAYKIKPKSDIAVGAIISGDADIYFDFNPPITTNNATTTVVDQFSVENHELNEITLYPNPTTGIVNISTRKNMTLKTVSVFSITGKQVMQTKATSTLDLSQLSSGVYFVKLTDIKGNHVVKKVVKK